MGDPQLAAEFIQVQRIPEKLQRLFLRGFSILDIAEPLRSFDAERPALEVRHFLDSHHMDLVGVRKDGLVAGFARREMLSGGALGDYLEVFTPDDVVDDSASLAEAIASLDINGRCFVTRHGVADAIVTFTDLEKPPVRMWLFGMITIVEMFLTRQIQSLYPDESWLEKLSAQRQAMAVALQTERARRGQTVGLLECIQFADKAAILLKSASSFGYFGFESKRQAEAAVQEFQSLRNNLAHTQRIIASDWRAIVRLSARLESLSSRF